jgi:hypothetical protein
LEGSEGISHILVVPLEEIRGSHVTRLALAFANILFPLSRRENFAVRSFSVADFDNGLFDICADSLDTMLVPEVELALSGYLSLAVFHWVLDEDVVGALFPHTLP